ncbi:MAG: hypothetical protein ABIZ81_02915, partial [Opitutaceae bacterium]
TLLMSKNILLPETLPDGLSIPDLLTPGAARALVGQLARELALGASGDGVADPLAALTMVLKNYFPPVPLATIAFQMQLAVDETTDAKLIPAAVPVKIAQYLSAKR